MPLYSDEDLLKARTLVHTYATGILGGELKMEFGAAYLCEFTPVLCSRGGYMYTFMYKGTLQGIGKVAAHLGIPPQELSLTRLRLGITVETVVSPLEVAPGKVPVDKKLMWIVSRYKSAEVQATTQGVDQRPRNLSLFRQTLILRDQRLVDLSPTPNQVYGEPEMCVYPLLSI